MPPAKVRTIVACPRCDRRYVAAIGETDQMLLNRVDFHVKEQHPDYDPLWYETHAANHVGERDGIS